MKRTTTAPALRRDDHFPELALAVRKRAALHLSGEPLFVVETPVPLYNLWLEGFEDELGRAHHACHCCRRFLEQYGALVSVHKGGEVRSVLWDEAAVPDEYHPSVLRLREAVEAAPIAGAFFDAAEQWGTARTPDKKRGVTWDHLAIPAIAVHRHALKTPGQRAAEVREERGMLARGLAEFPREAVAQAKALCESESLYRSEKVLGVAKWLLALHDVLEPVKNRRTRDNLLWVAAASAPAGFCHVRSTMIGTLLEDICDPGKTIEDARRAFASKMHPLQYQRPTAAPTENQIEQAEKAMERLGAARALERRFARIEDLELLWRPAARADAKPAGVFGHLRPQAAGAKDIGGGAAMTWEKFARTVLPTAERIEVHVPPVGPFVALVTAAHADAPPILQWDLPERRNPVSWYLYHNGARADRFNLQTGWRDLTGITLLPPMWHGRSFPNEGRGAVLVIDGARDVQHHRSGGFFVECLKSEFHGIRRTLEAYSLQAKIAGAEEATACGLKIWAGGEWRVGVRVTAGGIATTYTLDRWD